MRTYRRYRFQYMLAIARLKIVAGKYGCLLFHKSTWLHYIDSSHSYCPTCGRHWR